MKSVKQVIYVLVISVMNLLSASVYIIQPTVN